MSTKGWVKYQLSFFNIDRSQCVLLCLTAFFFSSFSEQDGFELPEEGDPAEGGDYVEDPGYQDEEYEEKEY